MTGDVTTGAAEWRLGGQSGIDAIGHVGGHGIRFRSGSQQSPDLLE
ncbi:hypothetical protein ACIGXF_24455 [Streptomyces sp. NPDC053086]